MAQVGAVGGPQVGGTARGPAMSDTEFERFTKNYVGRIESELKTASAASINNAQKLLKEAFAILANNQVKGDARTGDYVRRMMQTIGAAVTSHKISPTLADDLSSHLRDLSGYNPALVTWKSPAGAPK